VKKILIIDDEEWLREMVQMALRQRGYDVVEAQNGYDGIEWTATSPWPRSAPRRRPPPSRSS